MNRRIFLKSCLGGIGLPLILPSGIWAQTSDRLTPCNRISIGIIGVGKQGLDELINFLTDPRTQVVAVCDVNESNFGTGYLAGKKKVDEFYKNQDCKYYTDYRELLARPDIDAVYVATPDHWHAPIELHALRAGKDIYGQKPLAHTLHEGRLIVDAVEQYNRVFQTGSQQRSSATFRKAIEVVLGGYIGQLKRVEVELPSGAGPKTLPKLEEPIPLGFDWEAYLGPAPFAPYSQLRVPWNWRWNYDYGGGQLMDWVGHHVDIAQWGMGTQHTGPVKFQNITATFIDHPIFNTASHFSFDCVYDNGIEMSVTAAGKSGLKFIGTEGWIYASRSTCRSSSPEIDLLKIPANQSLIMPSSNHFQNFIDCVYSRREPIAPARYSHRSASIGQVATIAMRLGRSQVAWNPETEKFIDDETANGMLAKSYRGNWFV